MDVTKLKTRADIFALDEEELNMYIAEHILQWESVGLQPGVTGKIAMGKPASDQKSFPIPNLATDYGSMGDLISILVEDNRLALNIDRVNKISSVSLYDKATNKEYVSTHHDHRTVPRLLCEAALMYICDLPYEQTTKETNVCNMSPLPSGDNREHVHSDNKTEEHINGLASN